MNQILPILACLLLPSKYSLLLMIKQSEKENIYGKLKKSEKNSRMEEQVVKDRLQIV